MMRRIEARISSIEGSCARCSDSRLGVCVCGRGFDVLMTSGALASRSPAPRRARAKSCSSRRVATTWKESHACAVSARLPSTRACRNLA
jgi:hypothetical protein